MTDQRALAAREAHRRGLDHDAQASRARETRDTLVRSLRREDPRTWTYEALARAVGVSKEMIAVIVRGDSRTR